MTRNNDIETLLRQALEKVNQDQQDHHDEEVGHDQATRQSSRPIPLNADDQLAAIVLGAVNPRSNTL